MHILSQNSKEKIFENITGDEIMQNAEICFCQKFHSQFLH